jgi:hypothetical protein
MGNKSRDIVYIMMLAIFNGIVIWHVFSWNASGKYDEMYLWLTSGKAFLVVLYNLGLMVVFGLLMGLMMSKITEFMSSFNNRNSSK